MACRRRWSWAVCGLAALLWLAAQRLEAADTPPALLRAAAPRAGAALAERPRPEVRHRGVDVDFPTLRAVRAGRVRELRLNLFDDAVLDVTVEKIIDRGGDSYTVSGTVPGEGPGSFMLAVQDGVAIGNMRQGETAYEVRWGPRGQEVRQVDMRLYPPCGTGECDECQPVVPTQPARQTLDLEPAPVAADAATVFDVMVVYTPAARAAAGGTSAMVALINLAVDETNQAYTNSRIVPRVRLVYQQEVSYTEVDFSTDLSRLQNASDGYIDNVHTLRNQCGADLVSMIVEGTAACGIGYLMTTLSPSFQSSAFTVVARSCATGYYSFAHELGHNMGCHHAVGDSGLTRADAVLYPYCYGWRFNNDAWRTIMAYAPGTRIQYFSNPEVIYNGFATGVPTNQTNQAYNALCINNTASTVANWRSAVRITANPASTNVPGGTNVTFTVGASGTAPFSYLWKKDGVELSDGGRVSGALTASLTIAGVAEADEGSYFCRVTNLFSSAESAAAGLTVDDVTLAVASAFGMALPPVGANSFVYGTNVTCTVTNSPAVLQDAVSYASGICTGWTGSGSVPSSGAGTNVSFTITNNSTLTWRWQITEWIVSNQTYTAATNYRARDTVTALDGYRVSPPGDVTLEAGKTIRIGPEFSVASGAVFRATINTNL